MTRAAGGTTTNFQLTGDVPLLEKQGTTTTATYTAGNELLREDGEYPMLDGLGSERTVANSSQAVTGTVNYDAFGNTVGTSGSSTDPYMFAGPGWANRSDGDAGLMLVGARYYDAQTGRFITRDTDLSQAPYTYCGGDPVNAVDPSGRQACISSWCCGCACGCYRWEPIGGGSPPQGVLPGPAPPMWGQPYKWKGLRGGWYIDPGGRWQWWDGVNAVCIIPKSPK